MCRRVLLIGVLLCLSVLSGAAHPASQTPTYSDVTEVNAVEAFAM